MHVGLLPYLGIRPLASSKNGILCDLVPPIVNINISAPRQLPRLAIAIKNPKFILQEREEERKINKTKKNKRKKLIRSKRIKDRPTDKIRRISTYSIFHNFTWQQLATVVIFFFFLLRSPKISPSPKSMFYAKEKKNDFFLNCFSNFAVNCAASLLSNSNPFDQGIPNNRFIITSAHRKWQLTKCVRNLKKIIIITIES